MSAIPQTTRVERMPFVSLHPFTVGSGRVDPVSPEVAALLAPSEAVRLGVLPFALSEEAILVAVTLPLSAEAREVMRTWPEQVYLHRTTPGDIRAAVERTSHQQRRFGHFAVALHRAAPRALHMALHLQHRSGGRLGDILVGMGVLTGRDVAEIVAHQSGATFVDLISRPLGDLLDANLFDLMPEEFWRENRAVPFDRSERALYVASENPTIFGRVVRAARSRIGADIRVFATGRRDVDSALEARYRGHYLELSRDALLSVRPEDSAQSLLSRGQAAWVLGALALVAAGLWLNFTRTLLIVNVILQATYLGLLAFKLWLFRRPASVLLELEVTEEELAALDDSTLPAYTVLVPLRDEASVLPVLASALAELDYPKDRLDIKLLLEEDDPVTRDAALALHLPAYVEMLVLPDASPRTKPKACNYGLLHARGEYVVIYDAEDVPEPTQLKKAVVAFRRSGGDVACIQAKLSYYNRMQNALTQWFTAEYAMWFDLLLPGLQGASMPIPLGGTSNHLRTSVLRELGAWDPFNVTEDADLGIRLHKAGYRTLIMNSVTYEEANADFVNWIRQRSRWVKGYIQTWIVHMRHPVRLWRSLGTRGFIGFQAMILGTPLTFVLNPLLWIMTSAWFLTSAGIVQQMFPAWIYYAGMVSLLLGNFVFSYLNMVAVARRGEWELMESAMTAPAYWSLMSLAAWKAVFQLVMRPSHWEKTVHGLTDLVARRAQQTSEAVQR